jgi:hypothetical protein
MWLSVMIDESHPNDCMWPGRQINIRPVRLQYLNYCNSTYISLGVVVAVIAWWLDLQLPMQSVPITTDVVSSNLDQGEVYNIMW